MTVHQFAPQIPRSRPRALHQAQKSGARAVVVPMPRRGVAIAEAPSSAVVAEKPAALRWRRALRWFAFDALLLAALLLLSSGTAHAERIMDLADVAGVRDNPLVGYGLVVGLNGTGDQTTQAPFTVQSLTAMLNRLGVSLPAGTNPQLKNVAAVAIHAVLPAFAKAGQKIDVTVASIGNAGSLRGGSLLLTPLKGADGQIYALAQGNLSVGGLGVSGADGSSVTIGVPSAGRIPGGANVERVVADSFDAGPEVMLNLHSADFTTASRMVTGINAVLGSDAARAVDGVTVAVRAPTDPNARVAFVGNLQNIEVDPGDVAARVVINSRTGTVVIGGHVRVTPAAVAHGSLSVTITERPQVSQPQAFSQGQTTVTPKSTIDVQQQNARMFLFAPGANLDDIVRAINQVGAAPGDIIAILEALKEAGALRAELVVI
jgi:flagellar P-ring protein precursor FlgI